MRNSSRYSPVVAGGRQFVNTDEMVVDGHGTLLQLVGQGTVVVFATGPPQLQSIVIWISSRQYGVLQASAGHSVVPVTVDQRVPQPPLVWLSTETMVVGQGCVHVSMVVAHETVLQGPNDWHGVAPTVTVGRVKPRQVHDKVATSLFVQVGAGQKVQGVAPVVTMAVPHLAWRGLRGQTVSAKVRYLARLQDVIRVKIS